MKLIYVLSIINIRNRNIRNIGNIGNVGGNMQKIKLIKPTIKDKNLVLDYKKEFIVSSDSMDGTAGLMDEELFEKWFEELIENSSEATVQEGFVPSNTYLAMTLEDNKLVGIISIRHRLNDFLSRHGGNIGYSVRKSERKKGYAQKCY